VNEIEMSNMEMDVGVGRSYRYYNGSTVFPFGWGLSLTSFTQSVAGPGSQVGSGVVAVWVCKGVRVYCFGRCDVWALECVGVWAV
jgi:hypothetical protein